MSRPSSSRITVFDENAAPSARQSGLHRLAPPMARVPSVSSSTRGSKIIPRSPVRASRAKISSPSRKITYERSSLSLKQEKPVAEEVKKIKEQVAGLETILTERLSALSGLAEEVAVIRVAQTTAESDEALLDQIRNTAAPLRAHEELAQEVKTLSARLSELETAAQRSAAEIEALRGTLIWSERHAHARQLAEAGLHDAKLHALETDIQALREGLAQQKEVALAPRRMPRQEMVMWTVLVSGVLGAGLLRFAR